MGVASMADWFSFRGRNGRKEHFLNHTLVIILVYLLLGVFEVGSSQLPTVLHVQAQSSSFKTLRLIEHVLEFVVCVVLFVGSLAGAVKRLHDRDRSGWFYLIVLIPMFGPAWLGIELGLLRGTVGPNRFGPDPLAGQPSAGNVRLADWFRFGGRVCRGQYWLNYALVIGTINGLIAVIMSCFTVTDKFLHLAAKNEVFHIAWILAQGAAVVLWVALFIAGLAGAVKRLHDRDRSGWFYLIFFVPVIGTLWLLVELGFLRGTQGENRFGPDPLMVRS